MILGASRNSYLELHRNPGQMAKYMICVNSAMTGKKKPAKATWGLTMPYIFSSSLTLVMKSCSLDSLSSIETLNCPETYLSRYRCREANVRCLDFAEL